MSINRTGTTCASRERQHSTVKSGDMIAISVTSNVGEFVWRASIVKPKQVYYSLFIAVLYVFERCFRETNHRVVIKRADKVRTACHLQLNLALNCSPHSHARFKETPVKQNASISDRMIVHAGLNTVCRKCPKYWFPVRHSLYQNVKIKQLCEMSWNQ